MTAVHTDMTDDRGGMTTTALGQATHALHGMTETGSQKTNTGLPAKQNTNTYTNTNTSLTS